MTRMTLVFLIMSMCIFVGSALSNPCNLVTLDELCKNLEAFENKKLCVIGVASISSVKATGKILCKKAWSLKRKKFRLNVNGLKRPTLGKRYCVSVRIKKGAVWATEAYRIVDKSTHRKMKRVGLALQKRNASYETKLNHLLKGKGALSCCDLYDEWGNKFSLSFLPEMEEATKGYSFEIMSAGPDGEMGTLDDLMWHPKPINPRPSRWGEPEEEELEE